jgi:hypothetical protein
VAKDLGANRFDSDLVRSCRELQGLSWVFCFVTDFVHGDKIDLSAIDADTSSKKVNDPFTFVDNQTSTVVAHKVTWFESGGNTFVQADVDGNTTADLTVVLTGINHNLTASDFVL